MGRTNNINIGGNMAFIQQGDILLKRIKKIPEKGLKDLKTNILLEGEATGHSHKLTFNDFEFYEDEKKNRFLKVIKSGLLIHEEHKTIEVPIGDYIVDRVREYDHWEEETRAVTD
jgi:hypothetical protein